MSTFTQVYIVSYSSSSNGEIIRVMIDLIVIHKSTLNILRHQLRRKLSLFSVFMALFSYIQRSICRWGLGGLTPPLVEDDPHTGD